MKILLTTLISLAIIGLTSCGGDDCSTCTGKDPIFGIELTADACENGDGTITVTALGQDTTYVGTIATFEAEYALLSESSCN